MYLLDTNVVSELRKVRSGKADRNVSVWADSVHAGDLHLSVISLQELEIGILRAHRSAHPHVPDPRPIRDCLIAATALVHGLVVVTQSAADFEPTGVQILNPWDGN